MLYVSFHFQYGLVASRYGRRYSRTEYLYCITFSSIPFRASLIFIIASFYLKVKHGKVFLSFFHRIFSFLFLPLFSRETKSFVSLKENEAFKLFYFNSKKASRCSTDVEKNDLRFRLTEMLKLADKVVEFGRSTEKNLYQHRVIPCHAVTFHYVGTGTDIRIKFFFLYGLHLQIDKRFDVEPKRLRIDMRVIPCDISVPFQSFLMRAEIAVGERKVFSAMCLIDIRALPCKRESICKSVSSAVDDTRVSVLRISYVPLYVTENPLYFLRVNKAAKSRNIGRLP